MEYEIILIEEFELWLKSLQSTQRSRIIARLNHALIGHFGLHRRFDGLIELKWHNGLRVYIFIWKATIVVAINGGNKNGQNHDIKKAKKIKADICQGIRTVHKR